MRFHTDKERHFSQLSYTAFCYNTCMLDTILYADTVLSVLLRSMVPHNAIFDAIFSFLSITPDVVFIWIIGFAVLFTRRIMKNKWILVFLLFSAITAFSAVTYGFKPLFERPRPYMTLEYEALVCPRDFSFPSGHAVAAFSGAAILAAFDASRKRRIFYYIMAILISYSRIYLGCHYFVDVLVGGAIGYFWSKGVLYLGTKYGVKPSNNSDHTRNASR